MEIGKKTTVWPKRLAGLTVEQLLYGMIVLLAAVIRLTGLNNIPLSPAEAGEAYSVWQYWQPGTQVVVSGSPAYFSLTSLLTQVLGFSDGIMRLVPVLFGIALPLLPWFLRRELGRFGALATGLLLVFSPTLSFLSRTAGGQTIALFSSLLLFIAWYRYQENGNPRWFTAVLVSLALGLSSAPLFYSAMLALFVSWLAISIVGPPLFTNEEGEPQPMFRPSPEIWRRSLIIAGGFFAAIATLFLWNLSGLNGVARTFGDWLALFLAAGDLNLWLAPVLALGRYELMMLVIAGPAVVWAIWHGRSFPTLLVYWLTGSLLLILLQRGFLDNLAVLALPGCLLAGRLIGDTFEARGSWYRWPLVGLFLLFGTLLYFNLVRYSRLAGATGNLLDPAYHLLLLAAGLVLVIGAVVYVWGQSKADARQGVLLGLLAILLFYTWGITWGLNQNSANDTRERLVFNASDDELPLLAETIRQVSRQTTNSENDLEILMTVDSPALRWYLRDFKRLQVDAALPHSVNSQALITPMESIPSLESGYVGSDFGYFRPQTEHILSVPGALQWWLFRQSPVTINEERAIFWLRADLAGEGFE